MLRPVWGICSSDICKYVCLCMLLEPSHTSSFFFILKILRPILLITAINQGDEVLLFDPAYETYESCITLAGGIPVSFIFLTLNSNKLYGIPYAKNWELLVCASNMGFSLPFFCQEVEKTARRRLCIKCVSNLLGTEFSQLSEIYWLLNSLMLYDLYHTEWITS